MTKLVRAGVAVLMMALVMPLYAGVAEAGPAACERRTNDTVAKLLECVTLAGVREHQAAFQAIADANGGNRFSGLPGHDASVDYVVERLEAAGYDPEVQPFDYLAFTEIGPSALQQTAPGTVTYVEGVDFGVIDQSDPGDVTAAVTAVDLQLGLGNTTTSGCEAGDFAGFPAGNIALLQRGGCTFEIKAENAAAAGATGIVIFNQGDTADPARQGIPAVTLTANNTSGIPVLGTTYALGAELAATPGLTMRVFANTLREIKTTYNVLAETSHGDDSNVVMVGGHLDSVGAGPGINDNGSGSAAILEVAEQMRKVQPTNTVRFAWWGAEESGLVGSDYYVANLSQAERDDIALYLNFDMIGSPNYVRFVYDGDGSAFGLAGPDGSGAIEALFQDFYADRGLAFEPTQIDFRSDYAAFFDNGIPFGGLFTGAEGIKTSAQAAIYGGTVGEQYDPCYHAACDTYDNNSDAVLDLNSDAVALATLTYAMSTETVTPAAAAADAGAAALSARAGAATRGHLLVTD
jgi:Zn-dependent M28 family amino/carboxypeptidase